jgi:hypothetical protein
MKADDLFRSGLEREELYGATAFARTTRYWWARCLLERNANDDHSRAQSLPTECIVTADDLGMAQVAAETRAPIP